MLNVAAVALAATATVLPQSRTFWKPDLTVGPHPGQVEVRATLVGESATVAVYQEDGFAFSRLGGEDERAQIVDLIATLDAQILPRLTGTYGPLPDLDRNQRVVVFICDIARDGGLFWWFDQMADEEARRFGYRSNQGEVLYHRFEMQGNRRSWNLRAVASTLHQLLHYVADPGETAWSRLLAAHAPYFSGLANARVLWGDANPGGALHRANDPFTDQGWSPLFVEYVRAQFGDGILPDLLRDPGLGFAGLTSVLRGRQDSRDAMDLLADMAMACWVGDTGVDDGRFGFGDIAPRRPVPSVRVPASRPGAGYVTVGAGGMTHLVVDGTGERPLPITLQGDRRSRWIGRAVLLHANGPDVELPLAFDEAGIARLELPGLALGEAVVLAAVPCPDGGAMFDARRLTLQWGLGWVPSPQAHAVGERFESIVQASLPDGGRAARTRLGGTIERLAGLTGGAAPITTRYAWAPEAAAVIAALVDEARLRGLQARVERFVETGPAGVQQEWANVLVELPGSDSRRWPIVVAAHWDGARPDLDDAYRRALNLDDNASGVAVALEVASVVSRASHRAPVIVALLDGGYHHAAGARALLDRLEGHVAIWLELDGVGVPGEGDEAVVRLEGGERLAQVPTMIARALRDVDLRSRRIPAFESPHTGARLAAGRGIVALVVRSRSHGEAMVELGMSPEVEAQQASQELAILVAKGVSAGVLELAGTR